MSISDILKIRGRNCSPLPEFEKITISGRNSRNPVHRAVWNVHPYPVHRALCNVHPYNESQIHWNEKLKNKIINPFSSNGRLE